MKNNQFAWPVSECLPDSRILLDAVNRALSQYVLETDSQVLFTQLLNDVIRLTDSEFGLISRVLIRQGLPFMKVQAITNISWSPETREIYEKHESGGMEFSVLDSLYGRVMVDSQPVISNKPSEDERAFGCPHAHPTLKTFLGLPLNSGDDLLGMVCLANRKGGYDESVVEYLSPFLVTCGSLIRTHDNSTRLMEVEKQLEEYRTLANEEVVSDLGAGYLYNVSSETLSRDGETVLLTKNETNLMRLLVAQHDSVISSVYLESEIWKNGVTGDSSLRSLVMRLRKKVPGLDIRSVSGVGYMLAGDGVVNRP